MDYEEVFFVYHGGVCDVALVDSIEAVVSFCFVGYQMFSNWIFGTDILLRVLCYSLMAINSAVDTQHRFIDCETFEIVNVNINSNAEVVIHDVPRFH